MYVFGSSLYRWLVSHFKLDSQCSSILHGSFTLEKPVVAFGEKQQSHVCRWVGSKNWHILSLNRPNVPHNKEPSHSRCLSQSPSASWHRIPPTEQKPPWFRGSLFRHFFKFPSHNRSVSHSLFWLHCSPSATEKSKCCKGNAPPGCNFSVDYIWEVKVVSKCWNGWTLICLHGGGTSTSVRFLHVGIIVFKLRSRLT